MLELFELVTKAAADPNRVRILRLLETGELCVCQITAVMDLAPATVSKHLSLLKAAGLVLQRKEGRWVYYRLADRAINPFALAMLEMVRSALLTDDPALKRDHDRLSRVTAIPVQTLCDQGAVLLDQPASHCC